MRARTARGLLLVFLLLYTGAVTYPGALLSDRVRPLILGLPFSMAWIVAWIAASGIVLAIVHRVDRPAPEE